MSNDPKFTVARIAANMAGLGAYQYQQRDPRHIAAAWVEFRKFRVSPDEAMLKWIDRLAADVLNPTATRVRPKQNTVRDLEIYRLFSIYVAPRAADQDNPKAVRDPDAVIGKGFKPADAYADIARQFGLTVGNVKVIVGRVEKSLTDPLLAPPAFSKR